MVLTCEAEVQHWAAGRVIVRDEEGGLAAVKTTKAFKRAEDKAQRPSKTVRYSVSLQTTNMSRHRFQCGYGSPGRREKKPLSYPAMLHFVHAGSRTDPAGCGDRLLSLDKRSRYGKEPSSKGNRTPHPGDKEQ